MRPQPGCLRPRPDLLIDRSTAPPSHQQYSRCSRTTPTPSAPGNRSWAQSPDAISSQVRIPRGASTVRGTQPQYAATMRHLPIQDVRLRLADHLLPMLRMDPRCNQIPHRPGRHKDRRLAPEHLRRPLFQLVDGRVFPYTSSPTSASAIAIRIAFEGFVTVSLRKSIIIAIPLS